MKMLNHHTLYDDRYLQNIADETHYSRHYNAKMEALKECIRNTTKLKDQDIVRLCIEEDFDSKEVAAELNMTAVAVRSRLSCALAKLRDKCSSVWLENFNS